MPDYPPVQGKLMQLKQKRLSAGSRFIVVTADMEGQFQALQPEPIAFLPLVDG